MAKSYRGLPGGQPSDGETGYNWMDTYGDLVTLLLCFFVMLFAMSNIDRSKFKKIADSFSDAPPSLLSGSDRILFFGSDSVIDMNYTGDYNENGGDGAGGASGGDGTDGGCNTAAPDMGGTVDVGGAAGSGESLGGVSGESDTGSISDTGSAGGVNGFGGAEHDAAMRTLYTSLESYINERDISDIISISRDSDGIKMIFADSLFFDSGKADLKSDSMEILLDIIPFFEKYQGIFRTIKVEGHTDSRPISNRVYKNNWWLSNVRALNVAEYILESGYIEPSKISCEGRGEYLPIADNATPEGRAKNRRVELLLSV